MIKYVYIVWKHRKDPRLGIEPFSGGYRWRKDVEGIFKSRDKAKDSVKNWRGRGVFRSIGKRKLKG